MRKNNCMCMSEAIRQYANICTVTLKWLRQYCKVTAPCHNDIQRHNILALPANSGKLQTPAIIC